MKIRLFIAAILVAIAAGLSACSVPTWAEKRSNLSPRYNGTVLEAVDQNWRSGSSYKAVRVLFEDDTERSLTCTNDATYGNYVCPFLKRGDKISFALYISQLPFSPAYESDQIRNIVRLDKATPSR